MVAERDDYKMPPLFKGEITPEIQKKKEEAHQRAMEIKKKMDKIYNEKKRALAHR